eukprot:5293339-Prymnesium_polylepis.1
MRASLHCAAVSWTVDGSCGMWFRPLPHLRSCDLKRSLSLAAPPLIMQHAQAARLRPRSVRLAFAPDPSELAAGRARHGSRDLAGARKVKTQRRIPDARVSADCLT